MSWDRLHEIYAAEGVFLALGAGVSKESGIPTWVGMLERLSAELLGSEEAFREMRNAEFSLPAIAGVLRAHCDEDFTECVRRTLYAAFKFRNTDMSKGRGDFVAQTEEENPLLCAVASLAAARKNDGGFASNPRIHHIITFNIDTLLQRYGNSRFGPILQTIAEPGVRRKPDRINVYHMHGRLEFGKRGTTGRAERETAERLVIAEQDFFDFFNAPTHIYNYTFLYLLREYSCLFIGLSMQDDNIRRLLWYSSQEGRSAGKRDEDDLRHFAILKRPDSETLAGYVESSLRELGVRVLWVRGFDEIPQRLGALYEAGGGSWEAVYRVTREARTRRP